MEHINTRNKEALKGDEVPEKPKFPPVREFSEGGEYPRTCIGDFFRYIFKFKCKKQ